MSNIATLSKNRESKYINWIRWYNNKNWREGLPLGRFTLKAKALSVSLMRVAYDTRLVSIGPLKDK